MGLFTGSHVVDVNCQPASDERAPRTQDELFIAASLEQRGIKYDYERFTVEMKVKYAPTTIMYGKRGHLVDVSQPVRVTSRPDFFVRPDENYTCILETKLEVPTLYHVHRCEMLLEACKYFPEQVGCKYAIIIFFEPRLAYTTAPIRLVRNLPFIAQDGPHLWRIYEGTDIHIPRDVWQRRRRRGAKGEPFYITKSTQGAMRRSA